jgi:hypothetical protein
MPDEVAPRAIAIVGPSVSVNGRGETVCTGAWTNTVI